MTSNNPPEHPRRPVEIVPLPASKSRSGAFNSTRGAWREPQVETSVHEVTPGAGRPDPAERVWVISAPTDRAQRPDPAPSSPQNRLHALLLRERTALMAQIDSSAGTGTGTLDHPTRAALDVAPFPLPTVPLRDTRPKRSPKARSADASGRPLAADVAAAIARATGHETPPPPAPNLSLVRFSTARERLEIVPLDEPTHAADDDETVGVEVTATATATIDAKPEAKPGLAHMIDLRERRRLRNRKPLAYMCPTCDRKGIVDRIDNVTGLVSATCPRCLEMWTTEIHPDHASVDPH